MAAVDEKVKQIIVEQLGVDEGEVTSSASFVDDLGADSLDKSRTRMPRRFAPCRTRWTTSASTRKRGNSWDAGS